MRPSRALLAASAFASVANAFLSTVPAFASGLVVQRLAEHRYADCVPLIGWMTTAIVASGVLTASENHLTALLAEGSGRELRRRVFERVMQLRLDAFDERGQGYLLNRIDSDVDALVVSLANVVAPTLAEGVALVVVIGLMVHANVILTGATIIVCPLWFVVLAPAAKRIKSLRAETFRSHDDLLSYATEVLSPDGALLVKTSNGQVAELARFDGLFAQVMKRRVRLSAISQALNGALMTLIAVGPAIVFLVGVSLASRNLTDVATIVAFLGLQGRIYGPLSHFSNVQIEFANVATIAERIGEVFRAPTERTTGDETPRRFDLAADGLAVDAPGRALVVDLTLYVPAGTVAAIVGPSGCGKSTLARIILGLQSPSAGSMRIGDVDIERIALSDLRRRVAIVPQRPFLFGRTLRENLTLGIHASEDELAASLSIAEATDVVASLPLGLDETLHGDGRRFSGGEMQRLAIARALLRKPSILVLDEATSALDADTEARVLRNLRSLAGQVTVVHVTHRASVVAEAERVIALPALGDTLQGTA